MKKKTRRAFGYVAHMAKSQFLRKTQLLTLRPETSEVNAPLERFAYSKITDPNEALS
jgi:hypothetical protein